ncbi:PREDICTED: calcium release-activated calcium channel protein 1-like isoform X1 [Dinoponera quadriceps]|uniref:Calcium release-activated calcium channel protein 1-like isoform X1 n=1 Tax=Dinoponera quadriceps TaxID=609295 RepID=A0A6P3WN31_DINQU|nr:PREDICTED: calcium release-activated calcium channel protein 1-like isoform X1 [Dinoponera quadriceps]
MRVFSHACRRLPARPIIHYASSKSPLPRERIFVALPSLFSLVFFPIYNSLYLFRSASIGFFPSRTYILPLLPPATLLSTSVHEDTEDTSRLDPLPSRYNRPSVPDRTNLPVCICVRSVRQSTMSQSGDGLHTPSYLSWRKLQLSRAKLKASSKTSALLSGFAMVAMVEVQLNSDTQVPPGMLIAFAVCTTLLVAVHMLALMISTCILPNIEAVCNLHSISLVHESPHERLHWYIEVAWASSTLLGLLLFLLEIAILCWVKFYDFSQKAAWSACILLIPVLIIFIVFAIHFYRSLVAHKYEVTVSGIRELELLKEQIESTDVEGRNGVNLLQTAGATHIV